MEQQVVRGAEECGVELGHGPCEALIRAAQPIKAGEVVFYISGRIVTKRTQHTIQLDATRHVVADEDDLCSEYLRSLLLDLPFDVKQVKPHLRTAPSSARFFDDSKPWSPENDFELCLDIDRFDFVLQAEVRPDGNATLIRVSSLSLNK